MQNMEISIVNWSQDDSADRLNACLGRAELQSQILTGLPENSGPCIVVYQAASTQVESAVAQDVLLTQALIDWKDRAQALLVFCRRARRSIALVEVSALTADAPSCLAAIKRRLNLGIDVEADDLFASTASSTPRDALLELIVREAIRADAEISAISSELAAMEICPKLACDTKDIVTAAAAQRREGVVELDNLRQHDTYQKRRIDELLAILRQTDEGGFVAPALNSNDEAAALEYVVDRCLEMVEQLANARNQSTTIEKVLEETVAALEHANLVEKSISQAFEIERAEMHERLKEVRNEVIELQKQISEVSKSADLRRLQLERLLDIMTGEIEVATRTQYQLTRTLEQEKATLQQEAQNSAETLILLEGNIVRKDLELVTLNRELVATHEERESDNARLAREIQVRHELENKLLMTWSRLKTLQVSHSTPHPIDGLQSS